ncbi:hypothetical protein R6Q57_018129, partial [Mikania cordata]
MRLLEFHSIMPVETEFPNMISLGYIAHCMHFDAYGGYDDVENAKNHPSDTQTQESSEKIVDELFLNTDFRKRSVKMHQTDQNNFTQLLVEVGRMLRYDMK